jgi:molybdopterin-guanine dinucleotide biosynthesis protein B
MEREVTLLVDGKEVPLNPFSREIVTNVVLGLVGSFKQTDNGKKIEITIGPSS